MEISKSLATNSEAAFIPKWGERFTLSKPRRTTLNI